MSGINLVIVESPGKVKTIQQYLGKDYLVKASIGHIRDLEEHKLSVDVANGFKPEYIVPAEKKKVVAEPRERPFPGTFARRWTCRVRKRAALCSTRLPRPPFWKPSRIPGTLT